MKPPTSRTLREGKIDTNLLADPLFFVHHASVDWGWWLWQSQDLPARLEEISGRTSIDDPSIGNTTLATTLDVGMLAPVVTIADVMDIKGGLMCYEYI